MKRVEKVKIICKENSAKFLDSCVKISDTGIGPRFNNKNINVIFSSIEKE